MTEHNWTAITTDIIRGFRGHGFLETDAPERQADALAEEAGEVVGALRRYNGQSRRPGSLDEVAGEIADVIITGYLAAREEGWPLADVETSVRAYRQSAATYAEHLPSSERQPRRIARLLFRLAARYTNAFDANRPGDCREILPQLIATAYQLGGDLLGIDVDDAITVKLRTIHTRGWRDQKGS